MYVSEAVTGEIAMFTKSNNFYNFNIFPVIKLPNAKNRKKIVLNCSIWNF
jgi:hypothetical protein